MTNFEVKIRLDANDMRLRPGLSCTADIQTNMVKNVVSVPIQSVTIRTGDTNLSPEEIEKKKEQAEAKEKADNNAEVGERAACETAGERGEARNSKGCVPEGWEQSEDGQRSRAGLRMTRMLKSRAA